MIAGVPGAGISALFYLLAVLAMPFVAGYRAVRARSLAAGRWQLVRRQLAIALGIGAGLVGGGLLLTVLVSGSAPAPTVAQAAQAAWQVGSAFGRLGLLLGLLTLALVLVSVQLAALLVGRSAPSPPRRRARERPALEPVRVESSDRR